MPTSARGRNRHAAAPASRRHAAKIRPGPTLAGSDPTPAIACQTACLTHAPVRPAFWARQWCSSATVRLGDHQIGHRKWSVEFRHCSLLIADRWLLFCPPERAVVNRASDAALVSAAAFPSRHGGQAGCAVPGCPYGAVGSAATEYSSQPRQEPWRWGRLSRRTVLFYGACSQVTVVVGQAPPVFGARWQTVYRRFAQWSQDRVWARLHRVILDELGAQGEPDWSRCAINSVSIRAVKGGPLTGPNPTDKGKNGSKIHPICDRNGLPIPSPSRAPTCTTVRPWSPW
jgi:hypothetical protein